VYPQAPHAGTEAETRHHVLDTSMSGDSLNFEDGLLNCEAVESEQSRRRHAAPSGPAPTELTGPPQLAMPAPPAPPDMSAEGASHRPC